MNGEVFPRYNPTMPVTLSLLFVKDGSHHVEYEKCTHRLLGVSLGKSLPIIIMGVLAFFPCYSWERFLIQGFMIWTYVVLFLFISFNSQTWNYVAALICGFGVYQLLTPCAGEEMEQTL